MSLVPIYRLSHEKRRAFAHTFNIQLHESVATIIERVGNNKQPMFDYVVQNHVRRRPSVVFDAPRAT